MINEISGDPNVYLSTWQQLWLLEPLTAGPAIDGLEDWMRAMLASDVDAVRGRAALALAVRSAISPADLGELFDDVCTSARPDVAAAIAASRDVPPALLDTVRREGPIYELIVSANTQ